VYVEDGLVNMIFNNPIFQLPAGIAVVDMTFSTVRVLVIAKVLAFPISSKM
jgi:hypothetical protein